MEIIELISDKPTCVNIKQFLLQNGLTATLIKKVKLGRVSINGKTVTMRADVNFGDKVTVTLPDEVSEGIPPIEMPLDIIYEDEYMLVVNKPKNMPTHPSRGNSLPTLANGIMAYFNGKHTFRSINRLDRDTSGIVLLAKDQYSAGILSKEMKRGRFSKKYVAVVEGILEKKSGIIDAPIRREAGGSIKRIVAEDGKRAVTEYHVISERDNESLVEIILHTGRTHQIRVHFSYIGHPLKNDFLYGRQNENESYLLHCIELSLPHPKTGEILTLRSNPDFKI